MLSDFSHTILDRLSIKNDLVAEYASSSFRGLKKAAKWFSEMLNYIDIEKNENEFLNVQSLFTPPDVNCLSSREASMLAFAKSLFDEKEFDRSSYVISKAFNPGSISSLTYFICIYSKFLAIESRKANNELEFRKSFSYYFQNKADSNGKENIDEDLSNYNKSLIALRTELEESVEKFYNKDSYLIYLLGLINLKLENNSKALDYFVNSLELNPLNWASWQRVSRLVPNRETLDNLLQKLNSSSCWIKIFFELETCIHLHENDRAHEIIRFLAENGFVKSLYLESKLALVYDSLRLIEPAHDSFKEIFKSDPYLLDHVDVYSNVLYVREKSAELAELAHHCTNIAKYLPQTCCVIGNFYGLRGQHDKALLYFQRALKLKPDYALVWMLIGHEHVELRTINLAIHAYQQSIKHDPLDYRAWYGLGQMHELLNMHAFAIKYYLEAQYLFPIDSRPLIALGDMYEKIGRNLDARKCFWRAYSVGDSEGGAALIRLARCYEELQDKEKSVAAYLQFIKLTEKHGVQNESELAHAYLNLVHYCISKKHYDDAQHFANRCLDFLDTRELAKSLLRQITSYIIEEDAEKSVVDHEKDGSVNFIPNVDLDNMIDIQMNENETGTVIKKHTIEPGPIENFNLTPLVINRNALKDFMQVEENAEELIRNTLKQELLADKIEEIKPSKVPLAPEILLGVEESPLVKWSKTSDQKSVRRGSLLSAVEAGSKSVITPVLKRSQTAFISNTSSTPLDSTSGRILDATNLSAVEETLSKYRNFLDKVTTGLDDETAPESSNKECPVSTSKKISRTSRSRVGSARKSLSRTSDADPDEDQMGSF